MSVPAIKPERLLKDLKRLRRFGAQGVGVVRLSLSPIDIESRCWLVERMNEAGLEATIDGETLPYRMLRVEMSNEGNRDRRQKLAVRPGQDRAGRGCRSGWGS